MDAWRNCVAGLAVAVAVLGALPAQAATAAYRVRMLQQDPVRLEVTATLPVDGDALEMTRSWPGDIPEVADAGWPGLVHGLEVRDAAGHAIPVQTRGPSGWRLAAPHSGPLQLRYEVDYAPLAAQGWPAMREAAYGEAGTFVALGRSLFVTTPASTGARVVFELPPGWNAATPWQEGPPGTFTVASVDDLVENLLVLGRDPVDRVRVGDWDVSVLALGHWRPLRREILDTLDSVLDGYTRALELGGGSRYLVVMLPAPERGGEAFRASFAMTLDVAPSAGNRAAWANLVAHELFHRWNGWTWRGEDYASSQWFQEGFTEYAANLILLQRDVVPPQAFAARLGEHVGNYGRLATPLDAPGTRKGQPLYSGGALAAFTIDTLIREASDGQRDVWDLFRALDARTGHGARAYAWPDLLAALQDVAPGDWEGFHARYIHGTGKLPVQDALARAGLRLSQTDAPRVDADPRAGNDARRRWPELAEH